MYKIYLILSETENISQWKIGITTNIDKRLQILKVGNPNIVGVIATYEIYDREIAYKVETLVKKHFRETKVKGEWFAYECLNKEVFLDMCQRYETNAKIWKQIQNNIKEDKKYKSY